MSKDTKLHQRTITSYFPPDYDKITDNGKNCYKSMDCLEYCRKKCDKWLFSVFTKVPDYAIFLNKKDNKVHVKKIRKASFDISIEGDTGDIICHYRRENGENIRYYQFNNLIKEESLRNNMSFLCSKIISGKVLINSSLIMERFEIKEKITENPNIDISNLRKEIFEKNYDLQFLGFTSETKNLISYLGTGWKFDLSSNIRIANGDYKIFLSKSIFFN